MGIFRTDHYDYFFEVMGINPEEKSDDDNTIFVVEYYSYVLKRWVPIIDQVYYNQAEAEGARNKAANKKRYRVKQYERVK